MLEASTLDATLDPADGMAPGSTLFDDSEVMAIATLVDLDDTAQPEPDEEPPEPSEQNQRKHRRISSDDLWWLGRARVKYGSPVALLDLSVGGALVETDSALRPGMSLMLELQGLKGPMVVPAKVVRCSIASLNGRLRYRGACEFKNPLNLPELGQEEAGAETEHAEPVRLDLALKSLVAAHLERNTKDANVSQPRDVEWVIELLRRLHLKAAGGEEGDVGSCTESLLRDGIDLLRRKATWSEARATIARSLKSHLDGLTIGISQSRVQPQHPDDEAIYFALERIGSEPEHFINVQIPPSFQLKLDHFRFLRAAASLMTVLQVYTAPSSTAASSDAGTSRNGRSTRKRRRKAASGSKDERASGGLLQRLAAGVGALKGR